MIGAAINRARNAKARMQAAMAIPPDPLDLRRPPRLWDKMPYEIGAGGWPIEEPTQAQMELFVTLLRGVNFGERPRDDPSYGDDDPTRSVRRWLDLIVRSKVLSP